VLVNSGGAFQPPPGLASCSAGKAAMASLVRSLAVELGPMQHIPTPGECTGAVVFLASDLARAITDQAVIVNGGEYFR
jgi:NAD(P)-dependent dehydrogenase (short-subunit alcohol dehydrogenase family)